MHINRGFLVNERSARHLGIQRGSVGTFDPCVPDRVSTRAITDEERAQARITGTSDRSFLLGSWQQEQGKHADTYNVEPAPGKSKGKPARKAMAPKPAATADSKRRAKMSLSDYYAMERACGVKS